MNIKEAPQLASDGADGSGVLPRAVVDVRARVPPLAALPLFQTPILVADTFV